MRNVAHFLVVTVLVGCTTTKQIDVSWSDGYTTALMDSLAQLDRTSLVVFGHRDEVNESFRVDGDSIRFKNVRSQASRFAALQGVWREEAISRSRVSGVRHTIVDRRGEGALVAAGVGGLTGGIAGLIFALPYSYGCTCSGVGPSLKFGIATGVAAGILGWAISGHKSTTIYRFRPDTPQEMSVVISLGPTDGGAG